MFRRRIYAQGFTILAMVVGSAYWESDRQKRNQYNELVSDREKKDKHEAWLRELEARQEEEEELRRLRQKMLQGGAAEKRNASEDERRALEAHARAAGEQPRGGLGSIRSALEAGESRRDGPIMEAVRKLWDARR
jgi:membrane protein involved in colicin uptake